MNSVLPPNASPLEKAFDINNAKRFEHDLALGEVWSAGECPIELLPFLASALSVDFWDETWSAETKRKVIAASVQVHRHKGTAGALKTALTALDLGVRISEWFAHGGAPHTFRADIDVTGRGINQTEIETIFAVIASTKNARSHLEALRVFLSFPLTRVRVMSFRSADVMTIGAYEPTIPPQDLTRHRVMATRSVTYMEIGAYE